jgi:hypothetical protein
MFNLSVSSPTNKPSSNAGSKVPTNSIKAKPKTPAGRERLAYFSEGIRSAHEAIEDLESRLARLKSIIVEADAAKKALQDAVHADGGVELAKYSSGQLKPDAPISKLVAHAKTSGEAAVTAATAIPHTESLLQKAREQLVALGEEKHKEVRRVMDMLADKTARDYQRAFDAASVLHDKLCGFSSVVEDNQGDVRMIHESLRMPRFNLPSMGSADPFIRSLAPSELTVNASRRSWLEVQARLEKNCDADVEDLLS